MNVVTFLQEKGGQGKSTMSVTLATLLTQAGLRVLLVDLDTQGHATIATRVKREDRLYHMLKNNAPVKEVIVPAPSDYTDLDRPLLWVVPSGTGTGQIDKTFDEYGLKNWLAQVASAFDVVVMDTSPQIGHLHLMAYLASTWFIYPVVMNYLSIQGLYSSLAHLKGIQEKTDGQGNPLYQVGRAMGILPTQYRRRIKVQSGNLTKLKKQYGEAAFFSPISFLTAWDEGMQLRRPINRLGYDNDAAPEAEKFVQQVMQRMGVIQDGG
jgi:chromosome partitioning protein